MAAVIPAAIQAVGAIFTGNSQAAQYDAQKDTAMVNARLARQQASAAEDAQRRRMALQLGEARASAATSGFDPSSGSIVKLQEKSAGEMELDALTTRYEGTLKAISFDNEARRYKAARSAARTSGYLSAAASLAGPANSYANATKIGG